MIDSRRRFVSSPAHARLEHIFTGGGRLLRLSLPILCLLVFLAPAQAQPSNIRVNPVTGVVTWTPIPGRVDIELQQEFGPSFSHGIGISVSSGLQLTTTPGIPSWCCTVGQRYRVRMRIGSSGPWSAPIFFTYGVLPVSRSAARPTRKPTPTPGPIPTQDHSRLPAGAEVNSDSIWISMREVSGPAIGDPVVRAASMSAIDIWAPHELNAEVCFAGEGSLLLLDAAYSPRAQLWMDSYQRADGKTCARLDRNGTVALMPGQPAPAATPIASATPNPYLIADSLDEMIVLENCMVSANYMLNFRESPAGRFISLYLGSSEAVARTENWFKVRYLGETGWISAHFVTTEGDCE